MIICIGRRRKTGVPEMMRTAFRKHPDAPEYAACILAETDIDGSGSQNILKRFGFVEYKTGESSWWRLPKVETKPDADKLHTTLMGEERIRRNLGLGVADVVEWCKQAVHAANGDSIKRKGKNWYVSGDGFVLTINAHSHTIVTAHKADAGKDAEPE